MIISKDQDKERNKIMKTKVVALTLGICGSICIFILTWWLIIIGNADGPRLFLTVSIVKLNEDFKNLIYNSALCCPHILIVN